MVAGIATAEIREAVKQALLDFLAPLENRGQHRRQSHFADDAFVCVGAKGMALEQGRDCA